MIHETTTRHTFTPKEFGDILCDHADLPKGLRELDLYPGGLATLRWSLEIDDATTQRESVKFTRAEVYEALQAHCGQYGEVNIETLRGSYDETARSITVSITVRNAPEPVTSYSTTFLSVQQEGVLALVVIGICAWLLGCWYGGLF